MRLPSYLHQNQYGIFYFRICFPRVIRLHLQKREFKKTLKTKDKKLAISISRVIKIQFDLLCDNEILKMNWLETKQVLKDLVDDIITKFNEDMNEHGTYGDHITNYPEVRVENEACNYIELRSQNLPINIRSFPSLQEYTDEIILKCNLNSDPDKYDRNMDQVAEMLLKLRNKRLESLEQRYLTDVWLFEKVKQQIEKPENKIKSDNVALQTLSGHLQQIVGNASPPAPVIQTSITFHELINKFTDYKLHKNRWKSPRTIKLNQQKLNYILEFFQHIKGQDEIPLHTLNKSDAIAFEDQFRLLPTNRTKRFPNKDIGALLRMSMSGEFASGERMSDRTYNSYCDLLTGMFHFAASPKYDYTQHNYFVDLKVKITKKSTYNPFTDDDLKLFFNTSLYGKKEFKQQYAWRYWIPLLMLYRGGPHPLDSKRQNISVFQSPYIVI